MSDLILVHRAFLQQTKDSNKPESGNDSCLVWKTCLRQIFFFDQNHPPDLHLEKTDQVFSGFDAESFLAEVLCGLKSPLIGETEVFGQFKLWWKTIPEDNAFKNRNRSRIESLFSLVKNVREKVLCGQGSQSYGSLLRRYLRDESTVDILGAGHLVEEITPWIQKKAPYRIWSRNPEKVSQTAFGQQAHKLLPFQEKTELSSAVIVAVPLTHAELTMWLQERGFSKHHSLFDFRSDSADFRPPVEPSLHLKLSDFSSQHAEHRNEIEKKAQKAFEMIHVWKEQQAAKAQVRPYGWDDL